MNTGIPIDFQTVGGELVGVCGYKWAYYFMPYLISPVMKG